MLRPINSNIIESAKLFELITSHLKDLIILFDKQFSIIYISPSVKRLLGYELFEVVGKKVEFIFAISEPLRIGEPQVLGYQYKHKDEKRMLESLIKPVYSNGDIECYLAILRDVDVRESLRKELERALKKEKSLNEHKSKLISIASHEMKSPLATISSSLELISIYLQEDKHAKLISLERHIEKMQTQLERLNSVVDELLLTEKNNNYQQMVVLERLDLVSVIDGVIKESVSEADQKKISIKCTETKILIDSNKILLHHIFKNLIENSLKYSKPEKSKIQITIEPAKSQVDVSVKDNGIGIHPLEKDKIFDQFYRSNRNTEITGFGIGLSVVKECATMLDAKITIKSSVNKGSTFKISFPK
ncbi:sensor histidine kinase [Nubsella zeaxanthinifaciens]|uniref:sensor histidine kinase n=1 Tax=Nubsella zeaxanthinifaciens TaxID=392412 RepID=UPI002795FBF0|nr:HAMP domain-containing sensor histidine kinase [Nubsella zeaxanthinifaciens]